MKRIMLSVAILALVLSSSTLFAAQGQPGKEKGPQTATIQGEIVDLGCYLGHGAMGASHKDCATKCIAGGMPMGLLTSDKKLYVLTMSHEDAQPFNSCKDLAAEMVSITGPVSERNGVKSLEVTAVKQVKSEAKTTK